MCNLPTPSGEKDTTTTVPFDSKRKLRHDAAEREQGNDALQYDKVKWVDKSVAQCYNTLLADHETRSMSIS